MKCLFFGLRKYFVLSKPSFWKVNRIQIKHCLKFKRFTLSDSLETVPQWFSSWFSWAFRDDNKNFNFSPDRQNIISCLSREKFFFVERRTFTNCPEYCFIWIKGIPLFSSLEKFKTLSWKPQVWIKHRLQTIAYIKTFNFSNNV